MLNQGLKPGLLYCRQSPVLQADSLLTEPPGKPHSECITVFLNINESEGLKKSYDHLNGYRKRFEKIQYLVMIRTFNKVSIKGAYLNIIKATDDKSTAITVNGENLKTFPLRSGIR